MYRRPEGCEGTAKLELVCHITQLAVEMSCFVPICRRVQNKKIKKKAQVRVYDRVDVVLLPYAVR